MREKASKNRASTRATTPASAFSLIPTLSSSPGAEKNRRSHSILWFLLFAVLFSAQVVPHFKSDSIAVDEEWLVINGYYYLTHGNVISASPPLGPALQAVPLLFLGLKSDVPENFRAEDRNYIFLYIFNLLKIDQIMFWTRCVTLLLALGIGFMLYWIARKQHLAFLIFALTLWCFEPNLLLFAGVSKTETPIVFFCLLSFLVFKKFKEKKTAGWAWGLGIVISMAITTKFTAISLLPIFFILSLSGLKSFREAYGVLRAQGPLWAHLGVGLVAGIGLVYLPGTLFLAEHRNPWFYFLWCVDLLKMEPAFKGAYYFFGQTHHGWSWFYPWAAFWLKTTLPFSTLVAVGFFFLLRQSWIKSSSLWLPPLFFLVAIASAPALRYALPAFPFLVLLAATGAYSLWASPKTHSILGKGLVLVLILWHAGSSLANSQNRSNYFNDFIPSHRRIFFLGGSDFDIDLDVKRIAEKSRERHWKNVKLAYSSRNDPYYYGMPWRPWTLNDLKHPQPGWTYVVQAGLFQGDPEGANRNFPIGRSWAASTQPTGKVGQTWYYYETPGEVGEDSSLVLPSAQYFIYENLPYRKGLKKSDLATVERNGGKADGKDKNR